ncbi:MAG: hypothetical protein ACRCYO_16820 [Bacteroidia bacterium]
MKKTTVINALEEFPREFALDELMERLIVLEKIELGLQDVANGRTISHQKLKLEVKKWSK